MASGLPPNELLELFQIARQVVFRYQLDKLETAALRTAMSSIEKAVKDILSDPSKRLKRWEQLRRQELIKEMDALTLGIREQVSGEISILAGQAGAESAKYHSQTMSLGGKVQGFNNVALSPEQFRSFFQTTPLGGATLTQWVDKAFDATVRQGILEDLGAGVLQGKGYPGLVDNIMDHMKGFTRKEAVTLARTFVQTANVSAMSAVMAANSDIVKKWKWSSVLENGNIRTGTGTCLICAALDGNEYKIGEGPAIPKHPRCRCCKIPVTVSYRELGIDIDELEEVVRPWTERPDIPIGEGGRNILTWGKHQGEYASWFESRGEKFQKNVVGPRRYELIKSGKVTFKDLVDPATGRLYRLDELVGGGPKGGAPVLPKFQPAKTIKEAGAPVLPKFQPAKTIKEAGQFAKDRLKMSFVDFRGLDIDVVNGMNQTVYKIKQLMPDIRTNGIGNAQNAKKAMRAFVVAEWKSRETYKNYVKSHGQEFADKLAKKTAARLVPSVGGKTLAYSSGTWDNVAGGKLKELNKYAGVYVNQKYGKDAKLINEIVKRNIEGGWFAKGSADFRYIMAHEIAHEIDKTIGFQKTAAFKEIYERETALGVKSISEKLSEYGATAGNNPRHRPHEMVAEAWAEFMTSKTPRPLAVEIGNAILNAYYEQKMSGAAIGKSQWKQQAIRFLKQ